MPKKTAASVTVTSDNARILSDDEMAAVTSFAERVAEASSPVDDFDPAANMKRMLRLKAKLDAAKSRAESHKSALKETDAYQAAKNASETAKGLQADFDELLAELGREYPLFERSRA